jgi:hypothetical protein
LTPFVAHKCTPKPSVEKCDTITISRKVAEDWLYRHNKERALKLVAEIERALSKEEK